MFNVEILQRDGLTFCVDGSLGVRNEERLGVGGFVDSCWIVWASSCPLTTVRCVLFSF